MSVFQLNEYAVASSVVRAILCAEIRHHPFRVLILRDVLPDYEVDRLIATKNDRVYTPKEDRAYSRLDENDPITLGFRSQQVADAVEAAIGVRGRFDPRMTYDRPGVTIESHPDVPTKAGTIQIYLEGDEDAGTVIRGKNRKRVFKVPFEKNCGYMFKRTDTSFHSLDLVQRDRWSLLVPIFHK